MTVGELAAIFDIQKATVHQLCRKGYNPRPIPKTAGKQGRLVFFSVPTVEAHILKNLKKWKRRLERLHYFVENASQLNEQIYNEIYKPKEQRIQPPPNTRILSIEEIEALLD